jgi:hypothetical protein
MTRLEKIQLCIEKGITCDVDTGKVYGVRGNELISNNNGYKIIPLLRGKIILYQHQFIYYIATNEIVDEIDHINGDKTDNRIVNLRSVSKKQNQQNRITARGYYLVGNKYQSQIKTDNTVIYLGLFNTEVEARKAYLDAKKIYHII